MYDDWIAFYNKVKIEYSILNIEQLEGLKEAASKKFKITKNGGSSKVEDFDIFLKKLLIQGPPFKFPDFFDICCSELRGCNFFNVISMKTT